MTTAADRKWFEATASIEACALCGAQGQQVAHRDLRPVPSPTHGRQGIQPRSEARPDGPRDRQHPQPADRGREAETGLIHVRLDDVLGGMRTEMHQYERFDSTCRVC